MEMKREVINGKTCYIYGQAGARRVLIQPIDERDMEFMEAEVGLICKLFGLAEGAGGSGTGECSAADGAGGSGTGECSGVDGAGFALVNFVIKEWNDELSPWEAPAVFGDKGFGAGAEETLEFVLSELMPALENSGVACAGAEYYIGGYSLAGLFALWAAYRTDAFAGVAAASPSVWFPGWMEYAKGRAIKAERVYLSLGDREERTRNKTMAAVGDNIREMARLLGGTKPGAVAENGAEPDAACPGGSGCTDCVLEWNAGNHFKEPDVRMAKGFAWLLRR